MDDYDQPNVEAKWCAERRHEVAEYLETEGVSHGLIGERPAWHVAPYASVWAIESLAYPGTTGWWAISGDMPNDYVSASKATCPREAVRVIALLWQEAAECMARGDSHPTFRIGSGDRDHELAPLLASRAGLLLTWVADAQAWAEDEA